MNGSRFTMGSVTKQVVSMSVHVASVDTAPHNQYQVAIYSDNRGNPGQLVARSQTGILIANAWNIIAINATLQAGKTYWFAYNTNGTNFSVNNMNLSTTGAFRMGWSTSGISFGTWPNSFGAVSKQQGVFSIYVSFN